MTLKRLAIEQIRTDAQEVQLVLFDMGVRHKRADNADDGDELIRLSGVLAKIGDWCDALLEMPPQTS